MKDKTKQNELSRVSPEFSALSFRKNTRVYLSWAAIAFLLSSLYGMGMAYWHIMSGIVDRIFGSAAYYVRHYDILSSIHNKLGVFLPIGVVLFFFVLCGFMAKKEIETGEKSKPLFLLVFLILYLFLLTYGICLFVQFWS